MKINCPEISSNDWKTEWNTSGTAANVIGLSSKNWNSSGECSYVYLYFVTETKVILITFIVHEEECL